MDWRSRLNAPKTIKALDNIIEVVRSWRERLDWFQREDESTYSAEEYAELAELEAAQQWGESDEQLRPECFHAADVLLHFLHQPSRPWGVFHRSDLINAVSPLLKKKSLPSGKELADAVVDHLQDSLSSCRIRFEAKQGAGGEVADLAEFIEREYPEDCATVERDDQSKMPRNRQLLSRDYATEVDLGSVEEGVTGASISREDRGKILICSLKARVTPAARTAFSAAVRDIVATALSVATEELHAQPPLQYQDWGGIIPDEEREDSSFPQALHDGASSSGTPENSEPWVRFDLGTLPWSSNCILRFVDLVRIVFSTAASPNSERGGTRELRHALTTMADRSALATSPLGMVGSIFVFESCLAYSLNYKPNGHDKFVPFLTKDLGLGDHEKGRLDRVFQARNDFVHKLTYDQSVDLVLVAARLAWAAAHHLTCKVTGVYDGDRTQPEQLRESLRQILRTA